jgi:hypothetical protein
MTVVAWDGERLAADRQATYGDMRVLTVKIWQLASGLVLANEGDAARGLAMKRWFEAGCVEADFPRMQGDNWSRLIVAHERGRCEFYDLEPFPMTVHGKFQAWGVGKHCAMGALAMGAPADKAVLIANQYVEGCGLGADVFIAGRLVPRQSSGLVSEPEFRRASPLPPSYVPSLPLVGKPQ